MHLVFLFRVLSIISSVPHSGVKSGQRARTSQSIGQAFYFVSIPPKSPLGVYNYSHFSGHPKLTYYWDLSQYLTQGPCSFQSRDGLVKEDVFQLGGGVRSKVRREESMMPVLVDICLAFRLSGSL